MVLSAATPLETFSSSHQGFAEACGLVSLQLFPFYIIILPNLWYYWDHFHYVMFFLLKINQKIYNVFILKMDITKHREQYDSDIVENKKLQLTNMHMYTHIYIYIYLHCINCLLLL
jgi:hypothetical protein